MKIKNLLPIISLVIIFIINFIFIVTTHTSWDTSIKKYLPLKHEITKLDKSISRAHLWFGEAITGESFVDIQKDVMIPFEHKDFYNYIKKVEVILTDESDKVYVQQLYNIHTKLNTFHNLAKLKWSKSKEYGINSDADQEFNKNFNEISTLIEILSNKIDLKISNELNERKQYFVFILALFLVINISAFIMLNNHRRKEEKNRQDLYESEEKTMVTLRSIGEAVVTTDMSGNITFINTIAESLTEYTNAEVMGLHIDQVLNLVNVKTGDKIATPISEVLYNKLTKLISNGTKLISKTGKEYIISDSAAPLKKENGEIFGIVLIFQNDTDKHNSEKALEISEMRFRHILESVPALSIQGYTIDGTTNYWNKASEKLYGYTAAEAIGKNLLELIIPPHMREDIHSAMDNMFRSGEVAPSGELVLMKKDSSPVDVFSSHALINIPGNPPEMFCIDLDISDIKNAEQREKSRNNIMELIASQTTLAEILEAIVLSIEKQNPILLCSILLLDSNGKHLLHGAAPSLPDFYNEAINGVEIGAGVGSCGTAAFTGEQVIVEDIQNHKFWVGFKEIAAKAGLSSCWSTPILSTKDEILGTFAIYQHNTSAPSKEEIALIKQATSIASIAIEKNQSTIAIKTSEARFKSIFENNPAGIFAVNEDRVIITVNQQFSNIMGYTSDEIIGKNTSLIHVNEKSHIKFKKTFLKAKNGSKINIEYQFKKKNGETIWCELFGSNFEFTKEDDATLWSIIDISHRKKIEEKLKLSSKVFTHAREGIMITDDDANIIDVNESFSTITGYSHEEVIGKNPNILQSKKQSVKIYKEMWDALNSKEHWYGEIYNLRKNGETYIQMTTITAILDDKGYVKNYVALFSDVTLAKEQQKQLEHIAHYDALTNLPNRMLLADRLSQSLSKSKRQNKLVFVLYIDLDGFKNINDTHGHDIGDKLLIEVSKRINNALRDSDTLSRFGGDEFVAVLADLENFEDCKLILRRILSSASKEINIDNLIMKVSASIGVTTYPNDSSDVDLLIRHADQAMYIAKQEGKNRYHIFDTVHDSDMKIKQEKLEDISEALINGEFVLYYQPKVNMKTGKIIGAEALIRWQHPQRGLVPPMDFLPIIENHDTSIILGEWVIDTALGQIERWKKEGIDMPISVNIGALQIQQSNFSSRLSTLLKSHPKVSPSYLELEILETSALSDIADVSKTMNACIDLGVKFALDDFGTGYSSLTYMRYLPAALIKIDQTFVHNILVDSSDLEIVKGVIGLAEAFKRDVIAEGVETIEHATALLEVGCELAQGYGIGRPMPSSEIKKWMEMWKSNTSWKS